MCRDMGFSIIDSMKTAVLVDLSFFIQRYSTLKKISEMSPEELAKIIKDYVLGVCEKKR